MGWWSLHRSEPAALTAAADTQHVIAAIFDPTNRVITAAPPSSSPAAPTPSPSPSAQEEKSEAGMLASLQRKFNGRWECPSALSAPPAPAPTTASTSQRLTWDQLPPCPLAGYELTKQGLVDKLQTPPHKLPASELKDLLRELTSVEQNAKYDVDRQFANHIGSHGLHGLELLVNPCLTLTGVYLMTYKAAKLYSGALPQDSVLFTKVFGWLRRRMPAAQREKLAQRHRRLMQATNARVAASFLTGLGLCLLAWVSRPSPDVMEEAPDVQAAKQLLAYQRHTEAAVKWCWYVFYHHPAYRPSGRGTGGGDE